jgi:hypothetical protein
VTGQGTKTIRRPWSGASQALVTSASGTASVRSTRGRCRLLDEALTGWSPGDRAALARLTRRFSDRILALIEQDEAGQAVRSPSARKPNRTAP